MSPVLAVVVWALLPLWVIAIDLFALVKADRRSVLTIHDDGPRCDRFEVLVPIYGDVRFLENVEYLAPYGDRVVLCTTDDETPEFYAALDRLERRHRFRVFRTDVPQRAARGGRRSVAAPVRDKLIRDALESVLAPFVVCIDADTVTTEPLDRLVGAVQAAGVDLASVRLVVANGPGLLARLQAHEYRMAMRMRRLYPWLVSGACHVARTDVHREVMKRHSLFFQGNDAELGILADAMGFEVGHVVFDVPTTVPATPRSWWRQRFAWAGGEFRIYAVNARLGWRHPWFWFYGLVVVLLFTPLRWLSILQNPVNVAAMIGVYVVTMVWANWRTRDRALVLLPLYMLIGTLVLVPLSALSYVRMATVHRNAGIIRPGRWVRATPDGLTLRSPVPRTATVGDPFGLFNAVTIVAFGARYSVPAALAHAELWVSLRRDVVRIAVRTDAGLDPVVSHPRVAQGRRAILEQHLPPIGQLTEAVGRVPGHTEGPAQLPRRELSAG